MKNHAATSLFGAETLISFRIPVRSCKPTFFKKIEHHRASSHFRWLISKSTGQAPCTFILFADARDCIAGTLTFTPHPVPSERAVHTSARSIWDPRWSTDRKVKGWNAMAASQVFVDAVPSGGTVGFRVQPDSLTLA
eukprot:590914-Rhodomonas_salina.1